MIYTYIFISSLDQNDRIQFSNDFLWVFVSFFCCFVFIFISTGSCDQKSLRKKDTTKNKLCAQQLTRSVETFSSSCWHFIHESYDVYTKNIWSMIQFWFFVLFLFCFSLRTFFISDSRILDYRMKTDRSHLGCLSRVSAGKQMNHVLRFLVKSGFYLCAHREIVYSFWFSQQGNYWNTFCKHSHDFH